MLRSGPDMTFHLILPGRSGLILRNRDAMLSEKDKKIEKLLRIVNGKGK